MRTRPFLTRRSFLQSLGVSTAVAPFVPLLNASGMEATRPKRLLLIFTPDGTADSDSSAGPIDWKPQGTETDFALHQIHAALEPLKSKLVIPWGLKMSAAGAGEQPEAVAQPLDQLGRRQHARTRCGQLDRER